MNLSDRESLQNMEVRIHVTEKSGLFMPLIDFLEAAVQKFTHLFESYENHYYGIFEFISCGENLFELLEDIA